MARVPAVLLNSHAFLQQNPTNHRLDAVEVVRPHDLHPLERVRQQIGDPLAVDDDEDQRGDLRDEKGQVDDEELRVC